MARVVASADASQVLTAASVMKRSEDTAVLGLDGPRAALRKMRVHSIASLFVLDRHRRFVGILNADDAEAMISEGRSDLTEITRTDIVTVTPDTPVTELVPLNGQTALARGFGDNRQRSQVSRAYDATCGTVTSVTVTSFSYYRGGHCPRR